MISIGIDPSLTSTGVVVLRDEEVLMCETLPNQPSLYLVERVAKILHRVEQVVKLNYKRYPKESIVIALEGFSYGSKGRSVFDIGYLGWRIRELLINMESSFKIKWLLVPPSNLKKYASGKGNCKKEIVIMNVFKRWNQEFEDNNQADAYVLARVAKSYFYPEEDLLEFQKESMEGVKGANK